MSRSLVLRILGILAVAAPAPATPALAQVPAQNVRPQIGYVYPPGGRAGQTVEVRLGGYDWTPDMQLFPHDPRVKIEITGPPGEPILTPPPYWNDEKAKLLQPPLSREVLARITLPADMPPGPTLWQAANANGATSVGTFVVSDTAEFVEPEGRSGTLTAAALETGPLEAGPLDLPALPVTVSGRISRIAEVDAYRFTVAGGGLVSCRLDDRLGQPFHGCLTIRDTATGRIVADIADTAGEGALALFVAEPNRAYVASLHDVEFGGDRGYVYRLTLRQGPVVVTSLPPVVHRGESRPIQVIGWGLASGKAQLETATLPITVPPDAPAGWPDAPCAWFEQDFDTPAGPATARIRIAAEPIVGPAAAGDVIEPETADLAARQLTAPVCVSGWFDRIDPVSGLLTDRYQLAAKKGDALMIRADAASLGSPADMSLVILATDGKELARSEDLPGSLDAATTFRAPADGLYDLIVRDVAGGAPSPADVYRLSIRPEADAADFTLQVPDRLEVPVGGQAALAVKLTREGSWKGPVSLRCEGLGEGVSVPAELTIPADKAELKITVSAAETAAAQAALIGLVATATIGERTIEHRIGPTLLAVTLKPRCKVKSAYQDGGRIVNRGTTYPADLVIERLEGYDGPVLLQMGAVQQRQRRGMRGGDLLVPAGVERAQYPIFMPEWLETSLTCRMNVVGMVQVADAQGHPRYVTGAMDGFVVMSLEGGLFKLSHEPAERVVRPGDSLDIPVRVARGARLAEAVRVEIAPGDDLAGLVSAEPVDVPPRASTAVVRVRLASEPRLAGLRKLTIRGTALQDGRWPTISETTVPLYIEPLSVEPAAK